MYNTLSTQALDHHWSSCTTHLAHRYYDHHVHHIFNMDAYALTWCWMLHLMKHLAHIHTHTLTHVRAHTYTHTYTHPPPTHTHNLLVKVKIRQEVVDENHHFLWVTKSQEGDESHECLSHAGRGLHKGAVDAIQQHLQLVPVTAQLGELLQGQNTAIVVVTAQLGELLPGQNTAIVVVTAQLGELLPGQNTAIVVVTAQLGELLPRSKHS